MPKSFTTIILYALQDYNIAVLLTKCSVRMTWTVPNFNSSFVFGFAANLVDSVRQAVLQTVWQVVQSSRFLSSTVVLEIDSFGFSELEKCSHDSWLEVCATDANSEGHNKA